MTRNILLTTTKWRWHMQEPTAKRTLVTWSSSQGRVRGSSFGNRQEIFVTDVSLVLHYPSYLRHTVSVGKVLNDNNKVSFCDGNCNSSYWFVCSIRYPEAQKGSTILVWQWIWIDHLGRNNTMYSIRIYHLSRSSLKYVHFQLGGWHPCDIHCVGNQWAQLCQ